MLQNVNDIVKRAGTLLDDPANTRYTAGYLIPLIDNEADQMDVDLERLGMQYIEHIAIVNINANATDLTYLLADGQPLATMKVPKRLDWKLQGQPDTSYQESQYVDELDDVAANSIGALQWVFRQGALQISPSTSALTLRIYFDAISTDIYDPAQNVVRGTAHILALRVAAFVADSKGMVKTATALQRKASRSWDSFCSLVTMKQQVKQRSPRPIHRRYYPTGMPTPSAQQ